MATFEYKDYILDNIKQVLIFSTYLNISEDSINYCINNPTSKISNPLRIDVDPSLSFKWYGDKLIMRDFADRKYRGDIFEIVGTVLNLNPKNGKDFNLICEDIIDNCLIKAKKVAKVDKTEQRYIAKEKISISINDRVMNSHDRQIFNRFGLKDNTIDNNIRVVDRYWLNDWRSPYRYRTGDPCYCYTVNPNKLKLYFPYRNKKGVRFITDNRCPIECLNIIKPCEQLVLIKSIKDKLLIDQLNVDLGITDMLVIPFASETAILPKNIYDILIKITNSKNIHSLLDLDKVGIDMMEYHKRTNNITPIYFTADVESKDPTDMVVKYGYLQVLKRWETILNSIYGK